MADELISRQAAMDLCTGVPRRENMGLFRGMRTDNGDLVVGHLIRLTQPELCESYSPWYISVPENENGREGALHNVFIDTVGAITGKRDKCGCMITEGDILGHGDIRGAVYFDEEQAAFMFRWKVFGKYADAEFKTCRLAAYGFFRNLEILGNIHENPELLEAGEE